MRAFNRNRRGFTYIEMLVVVSLLALCFVPLLQMFAQSMDEVSQYSDLGTAIQLGRDGIEAVKNLRFTEEQIESQGTVWAPVENEPPLAVNGKQWRVKRTVVSNSDPLEVHIEVFRAENLSSSVIELATLIEDL
jgi:prepilin-type N-terminal cleavage/methylation domain-containing protein